MSILKKLDIVVGEDKIAAGIFEEVCPDFMRINYRKPSDYINQVWGCYENRPKKNSNINGKFFEYLLATLFIREGILPFYLSAKVAFVPNVIYDLMFYTSERGPVCLSAKTSLRERYKQADLEAIALKYVHRKALSYLITLSKREAQGVNQKIKDGKVIGLDNVLVASSSEFDSFVESLKKFNLSEPPTVKVIESNQVITREKVELLNN